MPLSIRFQWWFKYYTSQKVNGRGTDSAVLPEWPKWAKMLLNAVSTPACYGLALWLSEVGPCLHGYFWSPVLCCKGQNDWWKKIGTCPQTQPKKLKLFFIFHYWQVSILLDIGGLCFFATFQILRLFNFTI
jgi:hypothetical protein